ncbi:hypothetical protein M422DRAFT_54671 [Sphaerobolus stellatus SS14]|uniref:Unplaced genomic scaffold SPHSTscaffold_235, whole genome shotgun sequence n=1 Tax=Sphaerobolus stellatus (strain SS14) TaxID=990650 RepID=A0A0C9USG9_SPHS4|nr:hypothetical protein M422DRAFT_54671 [Sphaerobolus stellatus SS14]
MPQQRKFTEIKGIYMPDLSDEISVTVFSNLYPRLYGYDSVDSSEHVPSVNMTSISSLGKFPKTPCYVTSTPRFWSTIILSHDHFNEDRIRRQPQRCGDEPLGLFVRYGRWHSLKSFIPFGILQLWSENLRRIGIFNDLFFPEEYETLFPLKQTSMLPALQMFEVCGFEPPLRQPNLGRISASQLVFLVMFADVDLLSRFSVPEHANLEHLKYLYIAEPFVSIPCADFWPFITLCPGSSGLCNTLVDYHREESRATTRCVARTHRTQNKCPLHCGCCLLFPIPTLSQAEDLPL